MQIHWPHRVLSFPLLLVSLYLIVSPVWYPPIAPRMYDNARLLQLGLLALLGSCMLLPGIRGAVAGAWCALGRIPGTLILVLLAGGALSASLSSAVKLGALEVSLVAQLVLLFLCVFAVVRNLRDKAESVLTVAICAGAALVILKFWVTLLLFMFEGKPFQWVSPFLDFANVRFFSQYQAYSLLLIPLAAAVPGTSRKWQALVYVIAANFWAMQWMVASRAVWAGLAVAVIIVLALMRQGRIVWLGRQSLCVVAGGLIYAIYTHVALPGPGTASIPGVDAALEFGTQSDTNRVDMAEVSLKMLRAQPLFGVGPGQWGLHQSRVKNAHPHSAPLQLLSEYGIPAGTAAIALGALLLLQAAKTLRAGGTATTVSVNAGLCAALVMGLVDSLFSGNLIMPHSQILLCVVAGWLFGRTHSRATAGMDVVGPRALTIALAGISVLAVCTTAILAFEYVDAVTAAAGNFSPRYPHFWQYGIFTDW